MARLPKSIGNLMRTPELAFAISASSWNAASGLKTRVLFAPADGDIVLETTGNHNEIARFVKSNS